MTSSRGRFLARAAAATASFAVVRGPATAAEYQYKLGHTLPIEHPISVAVNEFAAAVRREGNNRLEIRVFPESVLGGNLFLMQQVRLGAIHMTLTPADVLSSIVPVAGIERLGFAFPDSRHALAAFEGDLGAYVRKEMAAKGFLTFEKMWENGYRQVTTNTHPIRTVDDLGGLRIRVPAAAISSDLFKALGAAPTPLDANEIYTSLQMHVVDAMEGSYTNFVAFKAYEVQRFMSVTNHQWDAQRVLLNPEAWKALPADLQAVVRRNANFFGVRATHDGEVMNGSVKDKLARLGLQTNVADMATFRGRLGDYYARWKREFGPTAWALLEQSVGRIG